MGATDSLSGKSKSSTSKPKGSDEIPAGNPIFIILLLITAFAIGGSFLLNYFSKGKLFKGIKKSNLPKLKSSNSDDKSETSEEHSNPKEDKQQ